MELALLPPANACMPAPERLGPYLIGDPLGKGGMGTVYKSRNAETGERVAVKTLAPELAAGEGFRERFEAEIESLRTLRHANIVRLLGFGEEDGVLFYSMELVDGVSLEDELRNGRRFDWREVTRIAIQVSRALKHAHDHGIIHRDIKPANILLTGEKVKLADFGIAQLFGGAKLTTARGVVGTADFMSPEQAESRPITDRCDQYSLGCVMYALLAGRPPFRAKGLPEMLQLQRYAEPEPVSRFATDTPKQLEKVVMQLLEKSPKDRFPNALALAKHLEAMSLALTRPKPLDDDFRVHADRPMELVDLAETPAEASKVEDAQGQEQETIAHRTRGPSDLSVADPGLLEPIESSAPSERRFTVVSDEPLRDEPHRPLWVSLMQGALLLTMIVGVGCVLFWSMQPASADSLFAKITEAAEQGEQALLDREEDIEEFLTRFPWDPRNDQVRPLQQRVEFSHAERRMMAMLRRREESDSPLESLYLEAMRDAKDHPERSLEKLRAVIGLMAGMPQDKQHEQTSLMLRLARQQADRLAERVEQRSSTQLPFLEERLQNARDLAKSDPASARKVCQALIDLFGDRPWARPAVEQAEAVLSELDGAQ